jgi:hypothetical protein
VTAPAVRSLPQGVVVAVLLAAAVPVFRRRGLRS